MRGQTSAEMLILIGAILISISSMLYLGIGSNESAVVMQAARDGAENAIASIDAEYGSSINTEEIGFASGIVTIKVAAKYPPSNTGWDNFSEIIKKDIREGALRFMQNAIGGKFPTTAEQVSTGYGTYDVTVEVRRLTK